MSGSPDLLDSPIAKQSVEKHANWSLFTLWIINASIAILAWVAIYIDVFSIMISGPFFILFSIICIYRGSTRSNRRSTILGLFGLLIVTAIILLITIYNLTPSSAQSPVSHLAFWLTTSYSLLSAFYLRQEYKTQEEKHF